MNKIIIEKLVLLIFRVESERMEDKLMEIEFEYDIFSSWITTT